MTRRIDATFPLELVIDSTAGQGALFSAMFIAKAGTAAGLHVAQTALTSAAVRSGGSTAHVILSGHPIDFPYISSTPDVRILLSCGHAGARPGAEIAVLYDPDTTPISPKTRHPIPIPAHALTRQLPVDVVNMVMVGAFLRLFDIVSPEAAARLVEDIASSWQPHELAALEAGRRAAERALGGIS